MLPDVIVFDIETIPRQLDEKMQMLLKYKLRNLPNNEEKEVKATQHRFLDPCYAEIKAIGVLTTDAEEVSEIVIMGPEEYIITSFFDTIANSQNLFVSFNGFGFDIPFILSKAMLYGIKPTNARFCNLIRYRNSPHFDIMQVFSSWGVFKPNLRELSNLFGVGDSKDILEDKTTVEFLKTASDEEIAEYCMGDVRVTYELFKKIYPVVS
jgi:predicted PolB exonuclease-like 3'-5' exonuclease